MPKIDTLDALGDARCAQDMPKICPRYAQDLPKISCETSGAAETNSCNG